MTSKDAVLYADTYGELGIMPLDGNVPDGVVLVGTTLYVSRRARGQILGVNSVLSGGHRIDYFTAE
ncbi:MAG TPA: hypothetical protein VLK58_28380 [Conexibacter sp.]|nr:hypothetical protein [Conexibacter sp.]